MSVSLSTEAAAKTPKVAGKVQKLVCTFRADGQIGVVPREVVILYSPGRKFLKVSSSFLVASDYPIVDARVGADTDNRLSLSWKVHNLRGPAKEEYDVRQRFSWIKTQGKAKIRGVVSGSDVDLIGSGTCKFAK